MIVKEITLWLIFCCQGFLSVPWAIYYILNTFSTWTYWKILTFLFEAALFAVKTPFSFCVYRCSASPLYSIIYIRKVCCTSLRSIRNMNDILSYPMTFLHIGPCTPKLGDCFFFLFIIILKILYYKNIGLCKKYYLKLYYEKAGEHINLL